MTPDDAARLRCPTCRGPLAWNGTLRDGAVYEGSLDCAGCPASWLVGKGLPVLYRDSQVEGTDRLMKAVYDYLGALHDPAVRHLLPILEGGGSEAKLRDGYMRRIDLGSLQPREDGHPVRILEVSIGGGANIPLMERDLPPGLDVEVWGIDLSLGMIRECLNRPPSARLGDVRIAMADAHMLPFEDHSFDRVFHVGGIGGFNDPAMALAEMARVAAPGTPIVVVDEQLDAALRSNLLRKAFFKLLTLYDPDPHAPREKLPYGATDVICEQISPFYYCLTFRMPYSVH